MRASATILLTYRCNAKCKMCNCHSNPTNVSEEINLDAIRGLPKIKNITISGGEPFLRKDINDIVSVLSGKVKRIIIVTNGYYGNRILDLCKQFPNVGIRISLDGLRETNDNIRGIPNGFDKCMSLIQTLKENGIRDIGISFTLQDDNVHELIELYKISRNKGIDFTVGIIANSFHYHKADNTINSKSRIISELDRLIDLMLKDHNPKQWARAYFIYGMVYFIKNGVRLFPCTVGINNFFIDPFGNVLPCQGTEREIILGNIAQDRNIQNFFRIKNNMAIVNGLRGCNSCWSMCNDFNTIKNHMFSMFAWIIKTKSDQ